MGILGGVQLEHWNSGLIPAIYQPERESRQNEEMTDPI